MSSAREHRHDRHDWIDAKRAPVHERLDYVVLEALPHDDERDPHDRRGGKVDGQGGESDHDRA